MIFIQLIICAQKLQMENTNSSTFAMQDSPLQQYTVTKFTLKGSRVILKQHVRNESMVRTSWDGCFLEPLCCISFSLPNKTNFEFSHWRVKNVWRLLRRLVRIAFVMHYYDIYQRLNVEGAKWQVENDN